MSEPTRPDLPPPSGGARRRVVGAAVAIFAVTLALYAPVARFSFLNFDDNEYITDNPFVRGGLTRADVRAAFSVGRAGHYHPLTWISHMIDVSLFGLSPGPMHVENAIFHAATTALLFLLVWRCLGGIGLAATAALVFGLHPMRIESVAWLAERKDVLSLFFALVTLHAWVSYTRRTTLLRYAAVVVPFVLGLLCKPTLVPLPLLLILLDIWPLRRLENGVGLGALVREKLPLLALSLASTIATVATQHAEGALVTVPRSLGDRIATAAVAYLAYAGKLVWPTGQGIFYPWVAYAPGVGVGAVVGLIAITAFMLERGRRHPGLRFGWLWFLVAPLPIIGVVQFGGQAFADRWTDLTHLGLIIGGVATLAAILPARARLPLALAACVAFAAKTAYELPHWATSERIFAHTLEVAPDNFMAHTNLGNALDAAGRLDAAAPHYEEAARLNPTYPEALNNLGTLRARRGQLAEAESLFRRALAVRPTMLLARYNLGLAESGQGRPLPAAVEWLRVLDADPRHAQARGSLQYIVARVLAPACDARQLQAPPELRAELDAALAAWKPIAGDAALGAQLARIAACF